MVLKSKTPKKKTVSQLKKTADAVFSQYVRQSASDSAGYASCVTCGVTKPWRELQCGHYISRAHNALRFDEQNCHPQCPSCNVFKHGNYPSYALWMVQTYGQSILSELEVRASETKQWKAYQLEEIIELYKAKLSMLT